MRPHRRFPSYSPTVLAIIAGLLVCVVVLVVAGCAEPQPIAGVPARVVERSFDDEDWWTTRTPHTSQSCSGYGTARRCTSWTYYTTEHHHDPPHWWLRLYQCGHKSFKKKGNSDGCGKFWHEVDSATFALYPDGSTITFGAKQ